MKRIARTLALTVAIVSAAPALAQDGWNADAFWRGAPATPIERMEFLKTRLDRGIADGSINRREAMRVETELNGIHEMAITMRQRDGGTLNDTDRAYIQERLDHLSQTIHWARHNGW